MHVSGSLAKASLAVVTLLRNPLKRISGSATLRRKRSLLRKSPIVVSPRLSNHEQKTCLSAWTLLGKILSPMTLWKWRPPQEHQEGTRLAFSVACGMIRLRSAEKEVLWTMDQTFDDCFLGFRIQLEDRQEQRHYLAPGAGVELLQVKIANIIWLILSLINSFLSNSPPTSTLSTLSTASPASPQPDTHEQSQ